MGYVSHSSYRRATATVFECFPGPVYEPLSVGTTKAASFDADPRVGHSHWSHDLRARLICLEDWGKVIDQQRLAADCALQRDRDPHHPAPRMVHDPSVRRRMDTTAPAAAPGRALHLSVLRHRRDRGAILAHLCSGDAVLQRRRLCDALRAAAPTMVSTVQPAGAGRGGAGAGLQYFGKLCHKHELAVVCAGNDDGLFRPDDGAGSPQFRLG